MTFVIRLFLKKTFLFFLQVISVSIWDLSFCFDFRVWCVFLVFPSAFSLSPFHNRDVLSLSPHPISSHLPSFFIGILCEDDFTNASRKNNNKLLYKFQVKFYYLCGKKIWQMTMKNRWKARNTEQKKTLQIVHSVLLLPFWMRVRYLHVSKSSTTQGGDVASSIQKFEERVVFEKRVGKRGVRGVVFRR